MILDKTSRKLLKIITTETPPMNEYLFTFDYVMLKLNLTKEEAFACIRFLDAQEYVSCVYGDIGFRTLMGFRASHKGYHYIEFWHLRIFEEILKSVLLPVVVAMITVLITTA